MPSIQGPDNVPGALPTFQADTQQFTRVREFQGSAGQEAANVFGNLSKQLGAWQDRAAEDVGKQQGQTLGLDPNYRPDTDESALGIARRNAANTAYGNNLEATARNQLGDAYEQYSQLPADQRNPARLQQMIGSIKDDFDQNHVFDQVRGPFDLAFGRIADVYRRQAQSDADTRQQDAAKASFLTNQNSARDTAVRVASLPSATDADVLAQVKQHDAAVDAAVNEGVYTAAQAVEIKRGFQQDVLEQRVLARFNATPDAQKGAFLQQFRNNFSGGGDYFANLKRVESGGDPNASSGIAFGLYQFTKPTWEGEMQRHPELGLTADGINDPAQQEKAARALTADNAAALTKAGVQVNNANLYMAHFLGPGGATQFFSALSANPSASFASVFPKEAAANPAIANGRSLADVYALMARKIGATGTSAPQGTASGLSADTVASLDGKMSGAIRAVGSQAQHAQKVAVGDIDADVKQMEAGYGVTDDEWAAKRAQYAASPEPGVADAFNTANAVRTMYQGFKGKTLDEVEAEVANLKGQLAQGATPAQAKLAEAADKYAGRMREQLNRNPLDRATADGVIPGVTPLDFSSPQATMRTLQARIPAVDQVRQHYGLASVSMLTPAEKENLKSVAAAGGEPMVQTAAAIARTLGPRAGELLGEIGGDAPSFGHFGVLAAMNGDPGLLRDAAWAISQDHQGTGKVQRPAPEAMQKSIGDVYGDAMRAVPSFAQGAKLVTSSALAAQIMREGLDPQSLDQTLVKQTLQKAAGATYQGGVQYGGVTTHGTAGGLFGGSEKVLAPPDVRADQLDTVLKAITDKDLAALPAPPSARDGSIMPASALHNAHLTSVGPGVYRVSVGDPQSEDPGFVMSRGGQRGRSDYFQLDLNALEPQLRARVPGAYK